MKFAFIVWAFLLLSGSAVAQKFSAAEVQKQLASGSNQLNQTLPIWINKSVRLDTSFAGPGLRLTYVATVMNSEQNVPAAIDDVNLERLAPGICNDQNRKVLVLNGVTFVYMYRRQDLKPLVSKAIAAADCGLTVYR